PAPSPEPSVSIAAPPTMVRAPIEVRSAAPVATTPVATAPVAIPKPADSLGEEIRQMDRARAALEGNDPDRSLAIIDDYESNHPHGAIVTEAALSRIRALVAKGDRAGAKRVATLFHETSPSSPHAARVRALVADP